MRKFFSPKRRSLRSVELKGRQRLRQDLRETHDTVIGVTRKWCGLLVKDILPGATALYAFFTGHVSAASYEIISALTGMERFSAGIDPLGLLIIIYLGYRTFLLLRRNAVA